MIAVMLRRLAGPLFVITGLMHFVAPDVYVRMMPGRLPAKRELVYASGVAEIAGGAGLMHPDTRRWAGWWLVATLIGVFPANVNMAINRDRYAQHVRGGEWALIARLPFQLVLIAWVRAAARPRNAALAVAVRERQRAWWCPPCRRKRPSRGP